MYSVAIVNDALSVIGGLVYKSLAVTTSAANTWTTVATHTITETGIYLITFQIYVANVASSTRLTYQTLRVSGTSSVLIGGEAPIGQYFATMHGVISVALNAGDVINVQIYSNLVLSAADKSVKLGVVRIK